MTPSEAIGIYLLGMKKAKKGPAMPTAGRATPPARRRFMVLRLSMSGASLATATSAIPVVDERAAGMRGARRAALLPGRHDADTYLDCIVRAIVQAFLQRLVVVVRASLLRSLLCRCCVLTSARVDICADSLSSQHLR